MFDKREPQLFWAFLMQVLMGNVVHNQSSNTQEKLHRYNIWIILLHGSDRLTIFGTSTFLSLFSTADSSLLSVGGILSWLP